VKLKEADLEVNTHIKGRGKCIISKYGNSSCRVDPGSLTCRVA